MDSQNNWIAWARVLQTQNHKVIELHELLLPNPKNQKNSKVGNNWIVWDVS